MKAANYLIYVLLLSASFSHSACGSISGPSFPGAQPDDLGSSGGNSDLAPLDSLRSHPEEVSPFGFGDTPKVPCLELAPEFVEFGQQSVGTSTARSVTLLSCGSSPVEVYSVSMGAGSNSAFALHFAPESGTPTPDSPLVLEIGEKMVFEVEYTPTQLSATDAEGLAVPDTGVVSIESDSILSAVNTALSGYGVGEACPPAAIECEEGVAVAPGTMLHLSAATQLSPSAAGTLQWTWAVVQPPDSASEFLPSPHAKDVLFHVEVVGTYQFQVTVSSGEGGEECLPASRTISVGLE